MSYGVFKLTTQKFRAYHCNEAHTVQWALKLKKPYKSVGDSHWLGDGSYFFDESSNGKKHAENWGKNHKNNPSIMIADIVVESSRLLDLTNPDMMDTITKLQEKYGRALLDEAEIDYKKNNVFIDGLFFNMWDTIMENKFPIDVIKKRDFYPFLELPNKVKSRVPNALVFCVREENCAKNMKEV